MLMMIIEDGNASLKPAMRLKWIEAHAEDQGSAKSVMLKAPAQCDRIGEAPVTIADEAAKATKVAHEGDHIGIGGTITLIEQPRLVQVDQ